MNQFQYVKGYVGYDHKRKQIHIHTVVKKLLKHIVFSLQSQPLTYVQYIP